MDGANAAQYLLRVVMPLSKPVFAVVALYYMVGHWNDYTSALYYIYKEDLYPLQSVLKNLLVSGKLLSDQMGLDYESIEKAIAQAELMKYGVIMVASVPMLCVYQCVVYMYLLK